MALCRTPQELTPLMVLQHLRRYHPYHTVSDLPYRPTPGPDFRTNKASDWLPPSRKEDFMCMACILNWSCDYQNTTRQFVPFRGWLSFPGSGTENSIRSKQKQPRCPGSLWRRSGPLPCHAWEDALSPFILPLSLPSAPSAFIACFWPLSPLFAPLELPVYPPGREFIVPKDAHHTRQ